MADQPQKRSLYERVRLLFIGGSRNLRDRSIFHKLSLIAFFAWIGLGADGLSSSCYGPPEAFKALGEHTHLGIFVALGTALTIFVISASYSQIIELFPTGGGGYLVASKLLTPSLGMGAGCALLVDYVLTISLSVASGVDALLSFFPPSWQAAKVPLSVMVILVLTVMNLRGVKDSVLPLVPIFVAFLLTHAVAIGAALTTRFWGLPEVLHKAITEVRTPPSELGLAGMLLLIVHSYGMGAGTYTGIEAVSNGLPILREPRVETGKRTMRYMSVSLAVTVVGLMLAYLLFNVEDSSGKTLNALLLASPGKTLNAVLLEMVTGSWPSHLRYAFVVLTLLSEGALLFVAAQTGFLDGPRVLASMAKDRWFPTWLSGLSDRLVTRNGILIMGGASLATILLASGSVDYLVVLYSINVFITFSLSQAGMVRHWWSADAKPKGWQGKLAINGIGLALSMLILLWVTVTKFFDGGWVTLLVTTTLIVGASLIRYHYRSMERLIQQWNLVAITRILWDPTGPIALQEETKGKSPRRPAAPPMDPKAKTAVILVNGYSGLGLQVLASVLKLFGGEFKNFIFVMVGVIDAGNFKGAAAVNQLQQHVWSEVDRYVSLVHQHGRAADAKVAVGTDVVDDVARLAPDIIAKYPQSVFFVGQLILPHDSLTTRWLHNDVTYSLQRRLSALGVPFVTMPVQLNQEGT